MKTLLLTLFACTQLIVNAQTVVEAQTITTDAGAFSPSVAPVTTLGLNVTSATTNTTAFPYSPSSSFELEIGYVSDANVSTGTITHVFANPVSISQVWLWNAYFDFELDHSTQNAQLTFRDEFGLILGTESVTFQEANAANLLPEVIDLSTEILGVKEIDFEVITLWGGNEISMRRLAYAGNGINVGINEIAANVVMVYPNPAVNSITIPVANVSKVEMIDIMGRKMETKLSSLVDYAIVSWEGIEDGVYYLTVASSSGYYTSRVEVTSH